MKTNENLAKVLEIGFKELEESIIKIFEESETSNLYLRWLI